MTSVRLKQTMAGLTQVAGASQTATLQDALQSTVMEQQTALAAMNVFPGTFIVFGDNQFNLVNPKLRFVPNSSRANVVISPDGQHMAYVAQNRFAYIAAIDGSHEQKIEKRLTP